MKKQILIITEPEDLHAKAIAWGLQQLGHIAHMWLLPDFPSQQNISIIDINTHYPSIIIDGVNILIETSLIEGVWMRRTPVPMIDPAVAKIDQPFARKEAIHTLRSAWSILKQQCGWWINPLASDWIENKAAQLHLAHQVGFKLPATLISNSPIHIRQFYRTCHGQMVHKSFIPMIWQNHQTTHCACTNKIEWEQLQDDEVLAACPAIFQKQIKKNFEVRVTVIGKQCFAMKLDSQFHDQLIDWRIAFYLNPFPTEYLPLSTALEQKIMHFMNKSQLLFGCFDFIVTVDNEWFFLEVNTMGQFLWVEEFCPELKLMDAFCRLLLGETNSARSVSHQQRLHFADFLEREWHATVAQDLATVHIKAKNSLCTQE